MTKEWQKHGFEAPYLEKPGRKFPAGKGNGNDGRKQRDFDGGRRQSI